MKPLTAPFFAFAGALCLGLSAALPAAETLTWAQASREALDHNPSLLSSQLAVRQADESVTIASAGLWPSLSAGAGLNRSGSMDAASNPGFDAFSGMQVDRSGYQGSLSASWNLFNGFGTLSSRSQSLSNLAARKADYAQASASLLLSLKQAFFHLLYDQSNAELLQALGERYHQDTLYQELVFKSGRTARWTFLKSQSDEAEIKWQIRQNSLNLQAGQAALMALLGRDSSRIADISVQGAFEAAAPPESDQDDLLRIASSHPAARAARAQLEASQAALRLSQASRYPSLSANGSYGYSGADSWGPSDAQWLAGLSLNFNLFSGGGQEAAIRQAGLGLEAGRADLQSQVAQLQASLHKAWTSYRAAYERLPVTQMAAEAGEERFKTVQKLYEAGRAAFLDYEQAESIYSQAQQQRLSSQLSAVQAELAYENAQGLGLETAVAAAKP